MAERKPDARDRRHPHVAALRAALHGERVTLSRAQFAAALSAGGWTADERMELRHLEEKRRINVFDR